MNLISQQEAVEKALKEQQELYHRPWGLLGLDTGVDALNLMFGGWCPGKVVTIAMRSGMGKTSLTTPIIQAGLREQQGRRAMFMFSSWEMEPSDIVDRNVCNLLQISYRKLKFGVKLFNKEQLANLKRAYEISKNLPVVYQPMRTNIKSLQKIFKEFIANEVAREEDKTGLKINPVLIIDYLGVAEFPGSQSRTHDILDFTMGGKELAKETGGTVVQFSQIKRESDQKSEPEISDIPESSYVEQNSDVIVIGQRPEHLKRSKVYDPELGGDVDSKGKLLLICAKGRFMGTGSVLINCDVATNSFWGQHHQRDTPYWEQYSDPQFWRRGLKLT